ncbi:MAG: hypothetical protein PHI12_08225 [Dehalococcoidales bacterium]|nr:hypothetical protein [Dehalococcoidales bacterium]
MSGRHLSPELQQKRDNVIVALRDKQQLPFKLIAAQVRLSKGQTESIYYKMHKEALIEDNVRR